MGQLGTSAGRTVQPGIVSVMFEASTDAGGIVRLDSVKGDNDYIQDIQNEDGGSLPPGVFAVILPNKIYRFAYVEAVLQWPDPYLPSGKFLAGAQFPSGPNDQVQTAMSTFGFRNNAGNLVTAPPNLKLTVRLDIQTYKSGSR